MGATAAIAGGMGASALGQAYGAYSQSGANSQNLQFQMQNQQMLQSYVNRMMQPGMNPYGQSILNFIGQGIPGSVNGFNPGAPQGAPAPSGGGQYQGTGQQPTDTGAGGTPSGGGAAINPNYNSSPGGGQQLSPYGVSAGHLAGPPSVGGYGGQMQYQYQNQFPGVDPSKYPQGTTIHDLLASGAITQAQVNQMQGQPADYNPLTDPNTLEQYKQFQAQSQMNPSGLPQGLSLQDWYNQYGLPATNFQSMTPTNQNQYQSYLANAPQQGNNGYVNAQGQYITPDPNAGLYIQNGQVLGPNGQVLGPAPSSSQGSGQVGFNAGGQLGYTPPTQSYGQSGATAYGQGSPMASYQQVNPFTFSPSTLGMAPMVSATGTQAMNAGQDALMQMMTRSLQPATDPSLNQNLQRLGSGTDQYDTSSLFKGIEAQSKMNLDQQVAALQGSAGSLGQRFGTAMTNAESRLRQNSLTDLNSQEQQIGMSAFNNAQAMRQPALNLSANLLDQANQVGQFNMGQQQSAAGALAGYGLQGAGQNLQASLANQGVLAQYGTSNANILNQAGQFNAGQGMSAAQFNAGQGSAYNNFIMQALSQAGNFQNQQGGYNSGLLGILGGVPVPQAQPSPWGGALSDIGQMGMLAPFLSQLGRSGSGNAATYNPQVQNQGGYPYINP